MTKQPRLHLKRPNDLRVTNLKFLTVSLDQFVEIIRERVCLFFICHILKKIHSTQSPMSRPLAFPTLVSEHIVLSSSSSAAPLVCRWLWFYLLPVCVELRS